MKIDELVELAYRNKPETLTSNDLLWVEVCKVLCEVEGITKLDDFFLNILCRKIPSSHSLAAAISVVKKRCPELEPTEEQKRLKKEVKERYINEYRNA
jgi:hypothetical protein